MTFATIFENQSRQEYTLASAAVFLAAQGSECKNITIKKLEVVSKPQIRPEGKAQADEKAQHTWEYVSILRRFATPPYGLGWGFETTSRLFPRPHSRKGAPSGQLK